mmetsp:Transcript_28275/g.70905  ORF Transcript_28275/g.70905 Transcript_28275/m.70905 type:complete len:85 (+) Transcript_28275:86-340(+)
MTASVSHQEQTTSRRYPSFFHTRGIDSEKSKFQKLSRREGSLVGRVHRSALLSLEDECEKVACRELSPKDVAKDRLGEEVPKMT